jgi:two-component system chemotaxis response regulator CheY
MKTLVAEDDFTSRLLLQELLKSYGPCHIAVNGKEAVEAVRAALEADEPYDLICLDIMMPEMDGQEALKEIRRIETAAGVAGSNRTKIVMTTALAGQVNVREAIRGKCDYFLTKPIQKAKLLEELRKLALIA